MSTEPQQSYELYSKHHSQVFNSLRRQIKKDAPMFAFGPPTSQLMMLIFKIYHENILRSLQPAIMDVKVEGKAETATTPVIREKREKLKCMFGIFEEEPTPAEYEAGRQGKLYVTISESPGTGRGNSGSDEFYMAKRKALFNLLKSANVTVKYEEAESPIAEEPNIELTTRWRRTPDLVAGNATVDDNWNTLVNYDTLKKEIRGSYLKDLMFLEPESAKADEDKINIYDKRIRDYPITVYFVDSWEYLKRRRPLLNSSGRTTGLYQGRTFRPFKKYKDYTVNIRNTTTGLIQQRKKWMAECNNGHLCTESKLFAYAHFNKIKAKTFLAYWIGSEPPPDHIIRGYCYRTESTPAEELKLIVDLVPTESLEPLKKLYSVNDRKRIQELLNSLPDSNLIERIIDSYKKEITDEIELLEGLRDYCKPAFEDALSNNPINERFLKELQTPLLRDGHAKLDRVLEKVVQPSAVVCPGCFANIQDYKDGKMSMWDGRDCYFDQNSVLRGGKSKKVKGKTKRNRKQNRKTRKH